MEKKKYQKPSMKEYKIRERMNLLVGSPGNGGSLQVEVDLPTSPAITSMMA